MPRAAKIAAVAALAAAGAAVLAVSAVSPLAPRAPAPGGVTAAPPVTRDAVPDHCRSATAPEARCAAAWDTKRRRFFGRTENGQ